MEADFGIELLDSCDEDDEDDDYDDNDEEEVEEDYEGGEVEKEDGQENQGDTAGSAEDSSELSVSLNKLDIKHGGAPSQQLQEVKQDIHSAHSYSHRQDESVVKSEVLDK